jgi:hypothetical protein
MVIGHQFGGSWHGYPCHGSTCGGWRGNSSSRRYWGSSSGCNGTSRCFCINTRNQLFSGNRAAVSHQQLNQNASRWGRHFKHDFVGFDFNQNFVDGNRIADFLFPLKHGGFSHRFRQLGDFDIYDSHFDSFNLYL